MKSRDVDFTWERRRGESASGTARASWWRRDTLSSPTWSARRTPQTSPSSPRGGSQGPRQIHRRTHASRGCRGPGPRLHQRRPSRRWGPGSSTGLGTGRSCPTQTGRCRTHEPRPRWLHPSLGSSHSWRLLGACSVPSFFLGGGVWERRRKKKQ